MLCDDVLVLYDNVSEKTEAVSYCACGAATVMRDAV
jgi:hypothetical protein